MIHILKDKKLRIDKGALEFGFLEGNLRCLERNVSRAIQLKLDGLKETWIDRGNDVVWAMNRPLSQLNDWLVREVNRLEKARKVRKQREELHEQISAMEAEGPVPQPAQSACG